MLSGPFRSGTGWFREAGRERWGMSKREAPLEVPIWVAVPWSCCVCVVGSVPTLTLNRLQG